MTAAVPLPSDDGLPAAGESDPIGARPILEATRRRLTERQAEVVAELVRAAEVEVDEVGYDGVTVRGVARRAGVAPATAYNYFSSKDHLLAEVLLAAPAGARSGHRRSASPPRTTGGGRPGPRRLRRREPGPGRCVHGGAAWARAPT